MMITLLGKPLQFFSLIIFKNKIPQNKKHVKSLIIDNYKYVGVCVGSLNLFLNYWTLNCCNSKMNMTGNDTFISECIKIL